MCKTFFCYLSVTIKKYQHKTTDVEKETKWKKIVMYDTNLNPSTMKNKLKPWNKNCNFVNYMILLTNSYIIVFWLY